MLRGTLLSASLGPSVLVYLMLINVVHKFP